MRYLILSALLCCFISSPGQYTPADIKKFRIAVMTSVLSEEGVGETGRMVTWYDERGHDTAIQHDGQRYRMTYQVNEKGIITRKDIFDQGANAIGKAEYVYAADGSYQVTHHYLTSGKTAVDWYDNRKRLDKSQLEDGSKRFYTYDNKGRLTSVMTMLGPGGSGEIVDLSYQYNAKGQRIREENKGTNPWVREFGYDAKGLVIRTVTQYTQNGQLIRKVTEEIGYQFVN